MGLAAHGFRGSREGGPPPSKAVGHLWLHPSGMGVSFICQQPSPHVSIPALGADRSMDAQFPVHAPHARAVAGLILPVPWKEGRRAGRGTSEMGQEGWKEEKMLFGGIVATLTRGEQPLPLHCSMAVPG